MHTYIKLKIIKNTYINAYIQFKLKIIKIHRYNHKNVDKSASHWIHTKHLKWFWILLNIYILIRLFADSDFSLW